MLLPKSIKKMIAVFRGGLSPQLIILSIALGFSFGLIPGWSGVHAFIVILFLLMNVHTGLFLISAGLGKSLCMAGAPVLYHLGMSVQDYLQFILIGLGKIPIIGLTDFSTYSVAGALVAGPVIGITAGVVFAKLVMKFRKSWVKLEEGSEAYKKWTSKKWVKIIDRILIGKKTKDVRAAIEGKSPLFRKAGLVLVGVPVLILVASGLFIKEDTLGGYLSERLAKANGAEVNIASIGISPFSGALTAGKVQITDPDKPTMNQFSVDKFSANAGVFNLLRGKVVIDDIQVENLTFNTPREKAGKVYESAKDTEETEEFDPSSVDIDAGDIGKMEKYFKNAEKLKAMLEKIQRFLPSSKKGGVDTENTVPQSYMEYLTAKAPAGAVARFIAKNISLEKVALESKQFGLSNIKITNLSNAPVAYGEPISIGIQSVGSERALNMEVDFESDGTGAISGTFANLDLAIFQSQMSSKNSMLIDKGLANGKFAGTISKNFIDMTIDLDLTDMQATSGGKGLFGLNAKTTSEVFAAMETLKTHLRIVGPLTSPAIAFDTSGLTDQFKKTLVDAGKKRLESEIQKQINDNFGDKIPDDIKKVIGDPEELLKGLGNFLGGKKK